MKLSLLPAWVLHLLQATASLCSPSSRAPIQSSPSVKWIKTLVGLHQVLPIWLTFFSSFISSPFQQPLSGLQPQTVCSLIWPNGLYSALNVPSSFPSELPTSSLRWAPLLDALTPLISVCASLLIWGCLPGQWQPWLVFAHWMGFHSFKLFFTYGWDHIFTLSLFPEELVPVGSSRIFWTRNQETVSFHVCSYSYMTSQCDLGTFILPSLNLYPPL